MKFAGSKVVFVGNIPYDTTEASMIEIFQEVGPVVAFRINKDRDTGKAKGYGFCEFHDAATAASAVRNLDGYELGGRQLRVAPAESDSPPISFVQGQPTPLLNTGKLGMGGLTTSAAQTNNFSHNTESQSKGISGPTPCTDAINATLASMTPGQIFELLTQINIMVQYSPGTAQTFLSQNPQLCYALFQALIILDLIDKDVLAKQVGTSPPVHSSRPLMHNPPFLPPNFSQQPMFSNPQLGFQPPLMGQGALPPPPFPPMPFINQHVPPFVPNLNSISAPNAPTPHDQHSALLHQVMQITPEQIEQLPPDQRNSLHALRAQLLGAQQAASKR